MIKSFDIICLLFISQPDSLIRETIIYIDYNKDYQILLFEKAYALY